LNYHTFVKFIRFASSCSYFLSPLWTCLKPASNVPQSALSLDDLSTRAASRTGSFPHAAESARPQRSLVISYDRVHGRHLDRLRAAGRLRRSTPACRSRKRLELSAHPFIVAAHRRPLFGLHGGGQGQGLHNANPCTPESVSSCTPISTTSSPSCRREYEGPGGLFEPMDEATDVDRWPPHPT